MHGAEDSRISFQLEQDRNYLLKLIARSKCLETQYCIFISMLTDYYGEGAGYNLK